MPGKKSYSLGNLCESLGIVIHDRHRAEGDAVATAKLLDLLLALKTQNPTYKTKSVAQIMTTRLDNIKKYILDKLPSSCGVYYFLNKQQQIIYIGKSVDMYARAISHFNSDLKKSKSMLNDLYNVDFVETGSELISLLLESEEIKKHKPQYNTARKKDVFTHCIDLTQREGVLSFKIVPYDESAYAFLSFTSYSSAREKLENWIDEKNLCLQYCSLTEEGSVCFNHQIKKCYGICAGQENIEDYNDRVKQLISMFSYDYPNFMIIDRGRTGEEKSIVLIRNHRYVGYGYIDDSSQIMSIDDVNSYLVSKQSYPDADDIVKSWVRLKRREIVKF
jgi:DNA polymerase-3 subunit epsilon